MVGRKEGKKDMRMYKVTSCILVILMVTFFSGCEKKQNEIIGLQLSGQQDILTYDEGVVWNTGEDVLLKKKGETNGTSIFQDPFYEKKMDEDIILQYIDKGFLYYIRTFERKNYELCSMELSNYKEQILYANCSQEERTYNYLGLKDKKAQIGGQREDEMTRTAQRFCKAGDRIYMLDGDSLYEINVWTKYKRVITEDIDGDTELVFRNSKLYYKNLAKNMVEYDISSGSSKCVSDWMAQKICLCGEYLMVQRMNGELYRCIEDNKWTKLMKLPGNLVQGDDKNIYCSESGGNKLVIYDVATMEISKTIQCKNLWSVATIKDDNIYYLVTDDDKYMLQTEGIK